MNETSEFQWQHADGTRRKKTRQTLTAVWMLKHGKHIHGVCDRPVEHPENLLVTECSRDSLCGEDRCIVQPKLEPAVPPGHVRMWSLIARWGRPLPLGSRMYGPMVERMIECCVRRRRDAERGSSANQGGSDVQAAPTSSTGFSAPRSRRGAL